MLRLGRSLAVGAMALGLGACVATTTFTSTWKAPEANAVSPVGKTVAALFITRDEGQRRQAEDILAADLTARGAHGVASYTLVPSAQPKDAEAVKAKLAAAGIQGVVTMRVVGKEQEGTYTPGYSAPATYGGFGPYWGYGWGAAYDPGYLQTTTYISIETLIYSLSHDKLLWAGTSRTVNPKDLGKLVQEVAYAVAQEMTKQGFLAPG
jgi:hypothetical protein